MGKIAILFFFLSPTITFALNCVDVSNAGTTAVNGTYEDTELTQYTEPIYYSGTYYIYRRSDAWGIDNDYNCDIGCSTIEYYSLSSGTNDPPGGTNWTESGVDGEVPAPDLSNIYTCTEEETGTSTPTTATTTMDVMALGSIVLGLGIIATMMFIGLVGYIFNRISSKKPWKY